jgi:outer membrane immunogenic protein
MQRIFAGAAGVVFAVTITGAATAADLSAPIFKAPPLQTYNWSGFYAGLGLGYGAYNLSGTQIDDPAAGVPPAFIFAEGTSGGAGWLATAQVGFDYQIAPAWVVGAFANWDWTDISGTHVGMLTVGTGNLTQKWAWAAGGRIGYLATPQLLTYVTGGYTQAHFGGLDYDVAFAPGTPLGVSLPSQTYDGWFVGAGVEYMIAPGWFAKGEYRYADYGSRILSNVDTATGALIGTAERLHPIVQSVRAGLSYKFNWGGGVPAAASAPIFASPAPAGWSGIYAGLGGGYGSFNVDGVQVTDPAVAPPSVFVNDQLTSGGSGAFATAQIGVDYQFAPTWVAGVFADWDWTDLDGRHVGFVNTGFGNLKQRWAWAAGGRLGYLVTPRVLTYVSGGYTQTRFSGVDYESTFAPGVPLDIAVRAQTYNGWFVGAGVEYMIAPGWFAKAEYRYADYGSKIVSDIDTGFGGALTGLAERLRPSTQTIRTELVYKFNWGG